MELEKLSDKELEKRLNLLIDSSRKIEVDILLTLVEVRKRNLDNALGFPNLYDYCQKRFGLTKAQALKRSQAARTIEFFPKTLKLLEEGKTHVSHLALLAPKMTQANEDKILDFLPGASKRNLEVFLQRTGFDGSTLNIDPKIELKLRCSIEMLEKLERLQGLLAQGHSRSDKENTVEKALDALLDKIDPIKKDQRRENRASKKKGKVEKANTDSNTPGAREIKRYIPETLKAAVRKRDGYQCTFKSCEGLRCSESMSLQVDHVKPWSLNGEHSLENLRLLCPEHNRFQAKKILQDKYHLGKEKSKTRAKFSITSPPSQII